MAESENVARFRLTKAVAQARVRSLARHSETIVWGKHALSRMGERGILDIDVLRILRSGYIEDEPKLTEGGEWQCKIVKHIRGGREAGVVTIILHDGRLFLKTVEWEDRR